MGRYNPFFFGSWKIQKVKILLKESLPGNPPIHLVKPVVVLPESLLHVQYIKKIVGDIF